MAIWLQLVLDSRPHAHQMMTMDQQLPQITLFHARGPDARKAIFHHQLQNQLRIPPIVLLLAWILPPDLGCIAHP
jgi:hypothetical protein